MKLHVLLIFVLLISCKKDNDCIDETKKHNNACTLQYEPVCGCNEKNYGNACEAKRDGVTSWENGKCK
jgi:hypothetical protein